MCIHILTVLFAIVSFMIIKQKRYKSVPLNCLIIFIAFIGFGTISFLSITLPYGKILVYSLGAITIGLIFILIGLNDVYLFLCCNEIVDGVYCGYNTYHGNYRVSLHTPVFEYIYNETLYREQTVQNVSYKQLNRSMVQGDVYSIYLNPKHPAVYILINKIKVLTIILIVIGLFFLTFGIILLY